jgi:hypothetical protein
MTLLPLILAAALLGCREQPAGDQPNKLDNTVAPRPTLPRPSPPIDRAALLGAVARAASAAAAGADAPDEVRNLDGRQFTLAIRFGCSGPATSSERKWLRWSHDADSRTIRLYARPTISSDEPLLGRLGEQEFEAVEGFWIPRPWLLEPACPATAAIRQAEEDAAEPDSEQHDKAEPEPEPEPAPSWPRIGIAQYFTSADSRTGRRDSRAYEARHMLAEGEAIPSTGFNLVLSGRLRAIAGRQVIECAASNADSPPECIISAEFQRASIEKPDTGEVIAEWGGG